MDCLRLRRRRQLFNYAGRSLFSRAISYSTRRLIGFQSRNSGDRSFLSSYQCNALFCRRGLLQPGDVYAPMLLFDTVFLAISLGLSGGTTPDLYVACCFTLVLSCICNTSRGLFVVTFLAPLVYGYVVLTGTMTEDPSVYLRLPLPLVISIFYGYFAQLERRQQLAIDREKQANRERQAAEEVRRQRERLEVLYQTNQRSWQAMA